MPFKNNGVHVQEYVYDFAVDGGVKDVAIDLSAKKDFTTLPLNALVKGVTAIVLTSVTSGSSATVSWGDGVAADGYSGTTIAKATLVAGYVQNGWTGAGSLVWDNTNDVQLYPLVASSNKYLKLLISTADLTAGKIVFLVEYYMPSLP